MAKLRLIWARSIQDLKNLQAEPPTILELTKLGLNPRAPGRKRSQTKVSMGVPPKTGQNWITGLSSPFWVPKCRRTWTPWSHWCSAGPSPRLRQGDAWPRVRMDQSCVVIFQPYLKSWAFCVRFSISNPSLERSLSLILSVSDSFHVGFRSFFITVVFNFVSL